MDLLEIFTGSDFFGDLDRRVQAEIFRHGRLEKYKANRIIFLEGQPGSTFFLLISGVVRLYKTSADARETTVKLVKPGEIFAETVLFEKDTYPVNAETASETELFVLEKGIFHSMLDDRNFRNEFIAALMRKQRYLTERILYLTAYDVETRFFKFLEERYGRLEKYMIKLSKKDIAASIGANPETLSRLIFRLKQRGILRWNGETLELEEGFWDRAFY